jgi:uncharacterized protein YdaU (DUF1376 family)
MTSLAMMPWFPGDFMRSTRGWSLTARGVYRELLDAQWDMGDLPTDPEELRQMIGATPDEWEIGWKRCEPKFPVRRTCRRNWRLEEHRSRSEHISNTRSEAGRKGGQASVEAKAKQRLTVGQANVKQRFNGGSTDPQANPEAKLNPPVQSNPIQSNPDSEPISNPTHTSEVSSSVRADSDPEKGSVCGTFKKIGGENPRRKPRDGPIPTTEEVMDQLREEYGRARK